MPWHEQPTDRGRGLFWGSLILLAALAHGLTGLAHGFALVGWVAASLAAFILPILSLKVKEPWISLIAILACALLISCLTFGTIELSYGHAYGGDLLLLAGFSLLGVLVTATRRTVERGLKPDAHYLETADDEELKLLDAVICFSPLEGNIFRALERVLGGDPFDSALIGRRQQMLDRLLVARFVSYRPEAGARGSVLRANLQAAALLAEERARREALWEQPAPKPGPRQRASALAERAA